MARADHKAGWLLDRAPAMGARTLPLPFPRGPAFDGAVTEFLRPHPADVFPCHVGARGEIWDGIRLARGAGSPAVVQTRHPPDLGAHPGKRRAHHHSIEAVDRLIAISEGLRRT